jgi:hypothetical protein
LTQVVKLRIPCFSELLASQDHYLRMMVTYWALERAEIFLHFGNGFRDASQDEKADALCPSEVWAGQRAP